MEGGFRVPNLDSADVAYVQRYLNRNWIALILWFVDWSLKKKNTKKNMQMKSRRPQSEIEVKWSEYLFMDQLTCKAY